VFDERQCKRGIEVLKNFRREWDDKNKTFGQRPLHDWSSHGADAFGEFAVNYQNRLPKYDIERRPRANIGHLAT